MGGGGGGGVGSPVVVTASPSMITFVSSNVAGIYTIQAAHELPTLNMARSLKTAVIPRKWAPTVTRLERAARRSAFLAFVVFTPICWLSLFLPAPYARRIIPVLTPLVLPSLVTTALSMRVEIIKLLIRRYEFWYQFLVTLLTGILLGCYTHDARAVVGLTLVPANWLSLLADANIHSIRVQALWSLLAAPLLVGFAAFIAMDFMDEGRSFVVLGQGDRSVKGETLITYGFLAVSTMHLHYAYNRRSFIAPRARTVAREPRMTMQLVQYRCRLQWRVVKPQSRGAATLRSSNRTFDPDHTKLRCKGYGHTFNAQHVLIRGLGHCSWARMPLVGPLLLLIAIASIVLCAVGLTTPSRRTICCQVCLLMAGAVNGLFFLGLYQLDVLRTIYLSYDFLYVFFHELFAHACAATLVDWDERALVVGVALLWLHWAMLIDAIPPIRRRQLHLDVRRCAAVIILVHLAMAWLAVIEILGVSVVGLVDRPIFYLPSVNHRGGGEGSVPLTPWLTFAVLLNRCFTLLPWHTRFLYRLLTYGREDLVLMRGVVEYEDYELYRREVRDQRAKSIFQHAILALSSHSAGRDVAPREPELGRRLSTLGPNGVKLAAIVRAHKNRPRMSRDHNSRSSQVAPQLT